MGTFLFSFTVRYTNGNNSAKGQQAACIDSVVRSSNMVLIGCPTPVPVMGHVHSSACETASIAKIVIHLFYLLD